MDCVVKDLDFIVKHWASYPRRHPSLLPLGTAGVIPDKRDWVMRAFASCNFSFIMRGRGEYRRQGRHWTVEAPCVLAQWPGEHVEYGPPQPEGSWDEVYLIYDAALFPLFQRQRLVDLDHPVWPIQNPAGVETQLRLLGELSGGGDAAQAVDRVDRVCERLILESWLPLPGPAGDDEDSRAIEEIMQALASNLEYELDLDALASRQGMSPATFRRRWARVMDTPPGRYRLEMRLREACRLLAETTRPIYEIARSVGFADEMYFSRRFHQELGSAPRTYRRVYQLQRKTASEARRAR